MNGEDTILTIAYLLRQVGILRICSGVPYLEVRVPINIYNENNCESF